MLCLIYSRLTVFLIPCGPSRREGLPPPGGAPSAAQGGRSGPGGAPRVSVARVSSPPAVAVVAAAAAAAVVTAAGKALPLLPLLGRLEDPCQHTSGYFVKPS